MCPIIGYEPELNDEKYDDNPMAKSIKSLYQLINVVGLDESNISKVTSSMLSTSVIKLGYAEVATNANITDTISDVVSVTVNVPLGGRDIIIIAQNYTITGSGAGDQACTFDIKEGTNVLNGKRIRVPANIDTAGITVVARVSAPSAGIHTYKLTALNDVAARTTVNIASANHSTFILVLSI